MTEEESFSWGESEEGCVTRVLYSSGAVMWIWVVPGPGNGATSERRPLTRSGPSLSCCFLF
jgi:hypothetical protein